MKDAEIAELRQMVEQLQASVADLQRGFERPVVQAEVVENSSSSSQLDQSLSNWVMTAPPLAPPSLVVEEATIAQVTVAVQGVLLNAQQAAAILPGKVFDGEEVTNVVNWSPKSGYVSPGTPQEIGTSPVVGTAVEETVAAPVSPTWDMYPVDAPSSPADFGHTDDVHSPVAEVALPRTPVRTPPRSPRANSLSSRASGLMNMFRRSPSQKRN